MQDQLRKLSDEMAMGRHRSAPGFLRTQPVTLTEGRDRLLPRRALRVPGRPTYPDAFRAIASMHGTRLMTDAPLLPHKLVTSPRQEIIARLRRAR